MEHVNSHTASVVVPYRVAAPNAEESDWRDGLIRNEKGKIRGVLGNALHALRHAPAWEGVLGHDGFATQTFARKPPPWITSGGPWVDTRWTDRDDAFAAEWMQRNDIMVSAQMAGLAVETMAHDRTFHPLHEYLNALKWDGVRRLDNFLPAYFGTEDTTYHRAIGVRTQCRGLAAVARVYQPGCKANTF